MIQACKIHQYRVAEGSITVPKGSQVLSVGVIDKKLTAWVRQPVQPGVTDLQVIDFYTVGTNWKFDYDTKDSFIGTVIYPFDSDVAHVFARYLDLE